MATGAVIAIVVVVIIVAALVAVAAMEMRRRRLRRQFGPEYDRLVTELGSRRKAEAELSARQRRVAQLDIRPLTREESARYLGEWTAIQERFVDTPGQSVAEASALITSVMRDRGYPADDQDQAMEALSVEHAGTLGRYREARLTSDRASSGSATTDDLRNALLQYRALFEELVGRADGASLERERDLTGRGAADTEAAGSAERDREKAAEMDRYSSVTPEEMAAAADTSPANTTTTSTAAAATTAGRTGAEPAGPAGPTGESDGTVTGDAVSPQSRKA
jgi:hypothetical protein